jgi:hypothetical protein
VFTHLAACCYRTCLNALPCALLLLPLLLLHPPACGVRTAAAVPQAEKANEEAGRARQQGRLANALENALARASAGGGLINLRPSGAASAPSTSQGLPPHCVDSTGRARIIPLCCEVRLSCSSIHSRMLTLPAHGLLQCWQAGVNVMVQLLLQRAAPEGGSLAHWGCGYRKDCRGRRT